jgi:hypothetical protein
MKTFFIKTNIHTLNNRFFNFKYIVKPKLKLKNNLTINDVIDEMKYIGLNFKIPEPFNGNEKIDDCKLDFFLTIY